MNKAYMVTGGIGKVLCCLPALKRANVFAVTGGWHEFYPLAGIKSIEMSSNYLKYATDGMDIVDVDVYHLSKVRSGEWTFVQGANYIINGEPTDEKPICDLPHHVMNDVKNQYQQLGQGKPIVVINPIGSNGDSRSMVADQLTAAIAAIKEVGAHPLIVCTENIEGFDAQVVNAENHVTFAAMIACADYLVGIDSAAMHIARAWDIPGSIFFGATAGVKYYPKWFDEYRDPNVKDYSPYVQHLHLGPGADMADDHTHRDAMNYKIDVARLTNHLKSKMKIEPKPDAEPSEPYSPGLDVNIGAK